MTQPSADGPTPAAPDVAPARAVAQPRPAPARAVRAREMVTAVVVTRGVTAYLPRALAAVAEQSRPPQRLLVVDAAPDARPGDLAAAPELQDALAALGDVPTRLVAAPGVRTFGGAVRAALADEAAAVVVDGPDGADGAGGPAPGQDAPVPAGAAAWLWLLHDDAAAEPEALAALVRAVEVAPSVGVAGVKQRTWDDPARVLEAGVTTSRFGRRMTGIDEPEVDQGQHDAREDVLAVGLAGALVRRDVWDDLGGPDPALGPYGDGLDLSRRARLAGHRVVVVPGAVVRHAQASVTGGRDGWDASRSARVRREAFVHGQLTSVPGWLVPVVAVLAVASGVVRALGRFATKEPNLVVGELVAPWRVLATPGRVARARRRARATGVLPRRTLRPLEATWRDVVGQLQDRRLTAAEARRSRTAPSELEAAELTALKVRRRWTLAAVAVAAVAVDLAVLGPLVGPVLGGARLSGGSLLFGDADLGGLWAAATSWWSSGGLGQASPPEPLLSALLPFVAVTGGVGGATALVLLGSLVLAALGAWFAAGAATRSVALRAWAALVWTAAPALLVGLDEARLGAVLAHVTLPWFLLALARGVGAARVDSVASGLVGARRLVPRAVGQGAVAPAADARPRYTFDDDTDGDDLRPLGDPAGGAEDADDGEAPDEAAHHDAHEDVAHHDEDAHHDHADDAVPDGASVTVVGPLPGPGRPPATGVVEPSLAAAAAAGLALVVLTAAAPVLLPAVLLLLVAVAPVVRRRARLLWVPVPALAVHGPVIAEAVTSWGDDGWRLLLADPGRPVAGTAATAWQQLLGWPVPAESWAAVPWSGTVWDVAPLVASGVVLLLALPALWLRPAVGRAARLGWVAVAVGAAAAVAASGTVSGVAVGNQGPTTATASASPGLSLALAGALAAALLGASGVRSALARRPLGWRHGVVGLLVVAAVAGPGALLGTWAWHARADGVALVASDVPAVPTVGRQLQTTAGLRVLELTPAAGGVAVTLLEGDGPQLTDTTRVVELRRLQSAWDGRVDGADTELAEVAARLAGGASSDVSAALADLGVGAVVVPAGSDGAVLAAALDATPGLERVTSTEAGIIWRVAGATSGAVGWARVVEGPVGEGETILTVPRGGTAQLPPDQGTRTLELAERADAGWQATVDGRALRSVETTWRQAFELPPDGGTIAVQHAPVERVPWLAVQGVVLLVTILLAVPLRRRKAVRR